MRLRWVLLLHGARRALESTITRQRINAAAIFIDVEARLHLAKAVRSLIEFVTVHGSTQLASIGFI